MTDNNEVRGKVVLWRAPHGSGEKWMYFDHEPSHLPIREPLVSGAAYAALQAEAEALRADAARYRWLIQHAYIGECYTHNGTIMEVQNCDRQVPVSLDFEGSVSDAIDAAISAMEGRE